MDPKQTNTQPTIQPQQSDHTNSWAIVGFIFAFLFPLLGLIFSIISLSEIKKKNEKGRGLAIAGIIVSIAFMIILVVVLLILLLAVASVTENMQDYLPQCTVDSADFACGKFSSMDEDGTITIMLTNKRGEVQSATISTTEPCIPVAKSWRLGETKTFTCLGSSDDVITPIQIAYVLKDEINVRFAFGNLTKPAIE
jgi:hypothetical protein